MFCAKHFGVRVAPATAFLKPEQRQKSSSATRVRGSLLPLDLRTQRLGWIAPRGRLDRLSVFAHARRAIGPEFGHIRAVYDVEEQAGTDAHLHECAEGEVDPI